MTTSSTLVIVADWSAAQGRKPKPQEDRCWLAWGTQDQTIRSEPLYQPTRLEAEATIRNLLIEHADKTCLIGFDFAIGYPVSDTGSPVLPVGTELCAFIASQISDDPSGVNNRFEIAAALNQHIVRQTGQQAGPFWGRPRELRIPDLPERRPTSHTGIGQFRACERASQRVTKSRPQSAWKLSGVGCVGSQALMGLPTIHRLLTDPALQSRSHLWPFEPVPDVANPITIAEIYPSMFAERSPVYWFKDARQVIDTRDAILEILATGNDPVPPIDHPKAKLEGWILGVPCSGENMDDADREP
jgi:molybdopterin-guanine dinucleotide biosynthesis adapter protein